MIAHILHCEERWSSGIECIYTFKCVTNETLTGGH